VTLGLARVGEKFSKSEPREMQRTTQPFDELPFAWYLSSRDPLLYRMTGKIFSESPLRLALVVTRSPTLPDDGKDCLRIASTPDTCCHAIPYSPTGKIDGKVCLRIYAFTPDTCCHAIPYSGFRIRVMCTPEVCRCCRIAFCSGSKQLLLKAKNVVGSADLVTQPRLVRRRNADRHIETLRTECPR
jgi:hypothetical protein